MKMLYELVVMTWPFSQSFSTNISTKNSTIFSAEFTKIFFYFENILKFD
jgi:hypothetical protein